SETDLRSASAIGWAAPNASSQVPTQVSSRSRASSLGSLNTTVDLAEAVTAARSSDQSGQCAPPNPVTSRRSKTGGDSAASASKLRSASWTNSNPQWWTIFAKL